jgi:hypothetical protein
LGPCELYDLEADPFAEKNIAGDHAREIAELHQLFLSNLEEHGASDEVLERWKSPEPAEGGSWAVDYE